MRPYIKLILLASLFLLVPNFTFAQLKRKTTVYVEPVMVQNLNNTITYGGRISPINIFPQMANYSGIIREIAVEVGEEVKIGDRLYSVQQTTPGSQFIAGWIYALNPGVVAAVGANEGEQISTGQAVVTLADVSSFRIDFFMNDRDVTKIKHLDKVYLKDISRSLSKAEDELKSFFIAKAKVEEIGQQLNIITRLESIKEKTTGRVTLLPIVPDLKNGLFKVRVEFDYNDVMSIGRFQLVELAVDSYTGIAISQSAITKRYGKNNVTIVRNGKIEYQEVEVARSYGKMVSINSGLNVGDEIVVASNSRYKLGDEVEVEVRSPKRSFQFRQKLSIDTMHAELGVYPSKEVWKKPYVTLLNHNLLNKTREELGVFINDTDEETSTLKEKNEASSDSLRIIEKYKTVRNKK